MISVYLLGLLLLTVLWNLYYARHWHRNLTISLQFLQDYVYQGEQAQMTERIENRKRLMLPVLEVSFHVDRRLAFLDSENTNVSDFIYKRDIFSLLGNQRVTRRLDLVCTKRGHYQINESWLSTFSLLYEQRFSAASPAAAQLYVYTARTDVSDIMIACERLLGNIQCAKRMYEDPFAFSSIREYTPTDPMKTINWKASAKTGELMVNTFESTLTERVMLYLDLEDSAILKYEYLVEESLSIAASLAQKLITRGMDVGLCTCISACTDVSQPHRSEPQAVVIEPAGGRKQLNRIEQILAKHKADGDVIPLPRVLSGADGDRVYTSGAGGSPDTPDKNAVRVSSEAADDTVMIFISKNADRYQTAIEDYIGRQRQAIWVLPYTKNDTCAVKARPNICLIKREVDRS